MLCAILKLDAIRYKSFIEVNRQHTIRGFFYAHKTYIHPYDKSRVTHELFRLSLQPEFLIYLNGKDK